MFRILLFLFLSLNLFSKEFTVASYNVENLFDLKKQKTEYKEYVPNTKSKWNKKTFNIKLKNLIKVIKEIDADIIALQEIENKQLMQLLVKKLPEYKYYNFTKYKKSSIGLGFLSKIKIIKNQQIDVKFSRKIFRPIQETTFEINNIKFKIFNNHWPSKRVSESYRIKYAKKLQDRLKKLPKDYDYILVGDFNSNYDEMQSFRYDKKLNNTDGVTGINQVLNTTFDKKHITYDDVLKYKRKVHFNLWLELKQKDRFSNKFRKANQTPDNIILSPALLDTKKVSYVHKSFEVFKPKYLYKNRQIIRWQVKDRVHQGSGYSDHLPIFAKFSTNDEDKNLAKKVVDKQEKISTIKDLYKKEKLIEPVFLKDVVVIYKNRNKAIVKQKNNKAIYIYKNAKDLKLGFTYDIQVNQIKNYNDLKEIEDYEILEEKNKFSDIKSLYLDANEKNILDFNNQNEIITNLKGIVKNRKLHFDGKTINLYAKDKSILPKHKQKILIKTGHLSVYRGNIQILIHKKSDYKVEEF